MGNEVSDICDADEITQRFGCTNYPYEWWRPDCAGGPRFFHAGIDLGWSDGGDRHIGAPMRATRAGLVVEIGPRDASGGLDLGPFAPCILTDAEGVVMQYGHASAVYVAVGDRVSVGQVIAAVGSRGTTASGSPTSSGGHVHLEVRRGPAAAGAIQGPPWVAGGQETVLDPATWLQAEVMEEQDVQVAMVDFWGQQHRLWTDGAGRLWHKWFDPAGPEGGPQQVADGLRPWAPVTAMQPAGTAGGPQLHVCAVRPDGALLEAWASPSIPDPPWQVHVYTP